MQRGFNNKPKTKLLMAKESVSFLGFTWQMKQTTPRLYLHTAFGKNGQKKWLKETEDP